MLTVIFASILIGLIFAPLGCLVLWKRYIYLSDGLAHASMLAVFISTILNIPIFYAALINTIIFSLAIFKINLKFDNNTTIGFVSSIMLSISLILSYIFPSEINFHNLLFGNILTITNKELIILVLLSLFVCIFLIIFYKKLVILVINEDIASVSGIKNKLIKLLFLLILSITIIFSIQIVGALLVTSILLIPAIIARIFAYSPLSMIIISIFFAELMNLMGIIISYYADLPFTPVIIISGALIYISLKLIQFLIELIVVK